MKRILFFALALSNWMAQAANIHIVDGSTRSKTVSVLKEGQRIELPAEEMQTEIGAPGGGVAKADVLMVYDPQTGLAFWRYQDTDPANPGGIIERFEQDSLLVVKDDRMVEFLYLGTSLWVRESREKFSSLADAQRALTIRLERFGETLRSVMLESYREVNLAETVGLDFLYEHNTPHPTRSAKLREVTASGSDWRVVLDGPNGDARAVTLGAGNDIKTVTAVDGVAKQ